MAGKTRKARLSKNGWSDAAWKRALARRLMAWYRRHKRDLPWRRTRDPYAIWVSEVMLQQTQVATVVPYFERFMDAYPTVDALAMADEGDILRLWEGLGYYRRARQMHAAARRIVEQHAGRFPRDPLTAQSLPGIGRYTAGAVLSISFDAAAPILEANTVRLLSRLVAYRGDVRSGRGQRTLWQLAEDILPPRGCGQFNQALMELGSLVCTPRQPACPRCPLHSLCRAHQQGQPERIPAARRRPPTEEVREVAVVVWRGDKILLRKRTHGERWAGLWDFVRFPSADQADGRGSRALIDRIRAQCGLNVHLRENIATLKHGVTRFRITLDCYNARCASGKVNLATGTWRWVRPDQLKKYALSTTGRKLAGMLAGAAPE